MIKLPSDKSPESMLKRIATITAVERTVGVLCGLEIQPTSLEFLNHRNWNEHGKDCGLETLYRDAVLMSLGMQRVSFAQLIKIYRSPVMDDTRYSPAECTGCRKEVVMGQPDMDRVSTSIIERHNLSVRMENRRFTRLTNAFSKRWANHRAALALYFAYYNFCRMHKTLRCTPAMAQGIVKSAWSLKDLLLATRGV